jgi:hypothetical protein
MNRMSIFNLELFLVFDGYVGEFFIRIVWLKDNCLLYWNGSDNHTENKAE